MQKINTFCNLISELQGLFPLQPETEEERIAFRYIFKNNLILHFVTIKIGYEVFFLGRNIEKLVKFLPRCETSFPYC
jgi:hypothetical protein